MSSSPEIQKLQDEIKELELRAYQKQLEQKKEKLLKEINSSNNEEKNDTKNEHDDECEEACDLASFDDQREAEKKQIYKYILGAILSYALLTLYMFSTFYIIYKLKHHGCGGVDISHLFKEYVGNATDFSYSKRKEYFSELNTTTHADWRQFIYKECEFYLEEHFDQNSAIVTLHNLTFGLVSAAVVSQIGSHQQQQQGQQKTRAMNKLTNQLLHATKATPGSHIVSRLIYNFITWTPRLYVLTWIFTGCSCLVCSSMWSSEYSGPLYVTGLAWLGMAITTVYLFFGLQEKETGKENNDSKKEEDGVVNGHYNDSNDGDDDGIDAVVDGNKHNEKNKKYERDLMIGNASEEYNAVTSSALLQTAGFRSRFVEEEDDNDEEEGALYLTGTSINSYHSRQEVPRAVERKDTRS